MLAVLDRILRDAKDLQSFGVGFAGINANDAAMYPADSFENMKKMVEERNFPFPYLHDATQAVARVYGAECTPDFFGLNSDGALQYRGRLDSAGMGDPKGRKTELVDAMRLIARTGIGPKEQMPSMGCSIKWKT